MGDPTPDDATGDDEVVDAELVDDGVDTDADVAEQGGAVGGTSGDYPDITEDAELDGDLVEMVEVARKIESERDEYLDLARRVQAEFENYKRRIEIQRDEQRQRAAESLALELLPVLDAGEAALGQGLDDVAPLHGQLVAALEKHGLAAVTDTEVAFDPNVHEAVMHEEGDGTEQVVAEVLRTGYLWNERVLRPAMVKVRG